MKKLEEALSQFKSLESEIVRSRLLSGESRIDGRDLDTVRPISIEVGVLPQAHGSALFTRGETQSISVATMDSLKLSQLIDSLHGDLKDPFMLHYNFLLFLSVKQEWLEVQNEEKLVTGNLQEEL